MREVWHHTGYRRARVSVCVLVCACVCGGAGVIVCLNLSEVVITETLSPVL